MHAEVIADGVEAVHTLSCSLAMVRQPPIGDVR